MKAGYKLYITMAKKTSNLVQDRAGKMMQFKGSEGQAKGREEGNGGVTKRREDITNIEARAINVGEFAKARATEINKLMKRVKINVTGSAGTGRARSFQTLPRHMRRRASSHNVKRLPRRLRDQYEQEKAKSEAQPKDESQARPKRSRRHRRRHSNLRQEFQRRQRQHAWLETHLWHAKRFKMADLWGMRIPVQPSDKSARATYRAVAKHCLIQDISYHVVIEVKGPQAGILNALSHLTSQQTGLTFGAKTYLTGSYHGDLMLYHKDMYPSNAIGPVNFLWRALSMKECDREDSEVDRQLWIWAHPACSQTVLAQVKDVCGQDSNIQVCELKDDLIRFRLRGPLSHPILLDALKTADVVSIPTDDSSSSSTTERWWDKYYLNTDNMTSHKQQKSTWQQLQDVQTSSELKPGCVVALTVRDPRILLPQKRTKIMADPRKVIAHQTLVTSSCSFNCTSPLWNADIREAVKTTQMSQHQLNQERFKLLVPGTQINLGRQESRIPVMLLHNPGVRGQIKKTDGMMGYGAGWDVVLPSGWAMAFWIALIYRGARAGGVRESRSCGLQQRLPHFPEDSIDTEAGKVHSELQRKELEKIQSRKPPAKRANYAKLGIASPFHIEWHKLVADWKKEGDSTKGKAKPIDGSCGEQGVVVVRDRQMLQQLDNTLNDVKKSSKNVKGKLELMDRYNAEVVAVRSVGNLKKRPAPSSDTGPTSPKKKFKSDDAINERKQSNQQATELNSSGIAAADETDVTAEVDLLTDSRFTDMFVCVQVSLVNKGAPGPYSLICLPTSADLDLLSNNPQYGGPMEPVRKEYALPRKPKKKTKSSDGEQSDKTNRKIITDKLGVPNLKDINLVRFCTRSVIGYLTNGVHALSVGKGSGVGFCCIMGLKELIKGKPKDKSAVVLVRDTASLQYRYANINVQL